MNELQSSVSHAEARAAIETGTGDGVRIAIIDSGVEVSHPQLSGLVLADDVSILSDGMLLQTSPGDGLDVFGHGTAIASVLRRVAPRATLGSFRVLNHRLGGRHAQIREGVRQALDAGYDILNCSFGCRGDAQSVMQYKEWIDEAYLRGVHVVAACNNFDFSVPEWPGYFPTVITVNMARATGLEFYCGRENLVEFAAAGENIAVAWRNGEEKSVTGSSYAAPLMAALLARLLSRCPDLSPLEAKALFHRIARPLRPELEGRNVVSRRNPARRAEDV